MTDTHLFAATNEKLVGMNCDEGLQDVLTLIKANEPAPDVLLFTGDASQDNSIESFQRLNGYLTALQIPQYWIPGNHDELQRMESAVGPGNPCFQSSFSILNWRIVMLNSAVPGKVFGRLSGAELDFLRRSLAESGEDHVMVCLHHNPVPVAAEWLQQHCLKNPGELFEVLDQDSRVKVVLFGHIHHELEVRRKDVLYLGSPSTCIQFHPSKADFALEDVNPGYRWIDVHASGKIDTGIRRVVGKRYNVDFNGIGY